MLSSEGIWHYMENLRCTVMDLSLRVSKAQDNVDAVQAMMQRWKDEPMFTRVEDGKSEGLLNIKGDFSAFKDH